MRGIEPHVATNVTLSMARPAKPRAPTEVVASFRYRSANS